MSEPSQLGSARSQREAAFFDAIGEQQVEAWWGHATPAGRLRAARRAQLVLGGTGLTGTGLMGTGLMGTGAGLSGGSAGPRSGVRALEVGCGAGFFATSYWRLVPPGVAITAVDISIRLIEHARTRRELADCRCIDFQVANVERLPFPSDHFDAVFGSSILHHLQLDAALPELLRVLRPGGRFSFAEPNMVNPDVFLARHVAWYRRRTQTSEDETAFTRRRLRRQLESVGLQAVVVTPFDFLHPLTPQPLIGAVQGLGKFCERVPGVREIAGSLHMAAVKP